jgi:hypothetical protein
MTLASLDTRRTCLVALGLTLTLTSGARGAAESSATSDWVIEPHEGVIRLRLAHHEKRRPDGGELLVDANRRVLVWEGIPGEFGCRQKLEVPFESVRAVRDELEGLIRLEIKGQPREKWVFVPLPHARWLQEVRSPLTTGFDPGIRDSLTGPDSARTGDSLPVGGSAAFAGPQMRENQVPSEVTADVRLAVERIRHALGRRPVPSIELYEALNGKPVEISIPELLASGGLYAGRAVRVHGVAELLPEGRGLQLTDEGSVLRAIPQPEIEAVFRSLAPDWRGQEVEVAGVLKGHTAAPVDAPAEIAFWEYLGPERVQAATEDAPAVTVRDLLERPADYEGRTVRVVGRFRGRNLEHDLPGPGPRSAWVIKSGPHAIWVTGRGPSGRGFALRPDHVQDTNKWLEVVGRPEAWNGATTLRAKTVALTAPQSGMRRGPRLATSDKPEVVFTLPLVNDEPVVRNAVFLVQFSTYMDEETFENRVRLRYEGLPEPQREVRSLRWRYDDVKRTLVVDPGQPLRPGASVVLQLLEGITDAWETPFQPAAAMPPDHVVKAFRWQVGGNAGS